MHGEYSLGYEKLLMKLRKVRCKCKTLISLETKEEFSGCSDGRTSAYNVEDPGSIPGSGRSSGEGNGNPVQYSCLENSMD